MNQTNPVDSIAHYALPDGHTDSVYWWIAIVILGICAIAWFVVKHYFRGRLLDPKPRPRLMVREGGRLTKKITIQKMALLDIEAEVAKQVSKQMMSLTNTYKIQSFDGYFDYKIAVDSVLSNLIIGISANKFEKAIQDLGNLLGFESTRPDKQYKSGPDNLWHYSNNHYLLIECKSEKMQNTTEITKDEIGQMSNHIAWFKDNYGKDETVKYVFIHPVSNISKLADIDNDIYALTGEGLDKLKTNVRGFIQEFERTDFQSISNAQVQAALTAHKLDIKSLEGDTYLKKCSKCC